MITLVVPPRDDIVRVTKLLAQEQSSAANIKSRQTRQSVITALTSTRESMHNYLTNLFRVEALQTDPYQWISCLLWCDINGRWQDREEDQL